MRISVRSAHTVQLVAAAGLVIALGGAVVLATRVDPREAAALRTPGAIVGVTYGSQPLLLGAPWQRWLLRAFPQLQGQIGGECVLLSGIGARSLVIWRSGGPSHPKSGGVGRPELNVRLEGDRGERLSESLSAVVWTDSTGAEIAAFEVAHYPRRGRGMGIWISDPVNPPDSPPTVLTITNPAPGRYPVWEPAPLPQRRRSGDLEVTLHGIRTGPTHGEGEGAKTSGMCLELELRERGQAAADCWSVRSLIVADATGNVWDGSGSPFLGTGAAMKVWLHPVLDVRESAYRVQLELSRSGTSPPGTGGRTGATQREGSPSRSVEFLARASVAGAPAGSARH